jgi:hypothetical protein
VLISSHSYAFNTYCALLLPLQISHCTLHPPTNHHHPQAAVRLLEDEYPAESLLLDEVSSTAVEQVALSLSPPLAVPRSLASLHSLHRTCVM